MGTNKKKQRNKQRKKEVVMSNSSNNNNNKSMEELEKQAAHTIEQSLAAMSKLGSDVVKSAIHDKIILDVNADICFTSIGISVLISYYLSNCLLNGSVTKEDSDAILLYILEEAAESTEAFYAGLKSSIPDKSMLN